jgi:hypothetical protein
MEVLITSIGITLALVLTLGDTGVSQNGQFCGTRGQSRGVQGNSCAGGTPLAASSALVRVSVPMQVFIDATTATRTA